MKISQHQRSLSEQKLPPFQRLKFTRLDSPYLKKKNKFRKIIRSIDDSFELKYKDQEDLPIIGPNAAVDYYNRYKLLDKIEDENQFRNVSSSLQVQMLKRSQELLILPCKGGLIKSNGNHSTLKISDQGYGDRYLDMVSHGMQNNNHITSLKLRRNRITSLGTASVLQHARKVVQIDLSLNRVGVDGCSQITKLIEPKESVLRELNLKSNSLGDEAVIILFEQLKSSNSILKLDLSENQIADFSAEAFKTLLKENQVLRELYLRWNKLSNVTGDAIFNSLIQNDSLLVLDISYNRLGGALREGRQRSFSVDTKKHSCTNSLGNCLKQNKTLLHLDLSFNQFNFLECRDISQNLRRNRSIYGFHFNGNYGYIDSDGFLIVDNEFQNLDSTHNIQQIKGLVKQKQIKSRTNCWICEGWQEVTINIKRNIDEPIFICLDYLQFVPIYLGKQYLKNQGIIHKSFTRMMPVGTIKFYFQNILEQRFLSEDYPQQYQFNIIINSYNKPIITKYNQSTFKTAPRKRYETFLPDEEENKWSFPQSIWYKDFKFEDLVIKINLYHQKDLLRKCFEKDWNCSKIPKFIKNPYQQDQVKELLWQNYKCIKETYKQLASYYPQGDIWCISWNAITEFIVDVGIVDGKSLKLSDVDLKVQNQINIKSNFQFIATYSSSIEWRGNPRNPDRSLIRYQFMEFLVRIADDKYLKNNIAQSYFDATQMLLDQCLQFMGQYDEQKWRNERYFNEECDMVCKKYRVLVNNLFQQFSFKKVKPGQRRFVSLEELQEICKRANLYDEAFVDKDVNLAYNLSMLTQIDELESDRISQMTWIEFLESLARIAEKVSIEPLLGVFEEQLNFVERQKLDLHFKLESLMIRLLDRLADEETKSKIKINTNSMFAKTVLDTVSQSSYITIA